MKALPKILLALTAVAALSLAYPASVEAVPTTYQYTGNPFTLAISPYTTSDFVSGMVTLAGPLAPNMPLTTVTPIAFSFSDGVQTITDFFAVNATFEFATGPTGGITGWFVSMFVPAGHITTQNSGGLVNDTASIGAVGRGINQGVPGTWVTGVPDTGSTLSLITLTFMALGLVARRFQRAAA